LITVNSIFADISDEINYENYEQKTGTLFAIRALLSKIASGVGSLFAGILIDVIHFPSQAEFGTVSEEIVRNLGIVSGPVLGVLGLIPIIFFRNYQLDKKRHEMIQSELEKR
jgi:Na+/melibiose symporter-like transporter